MHSRENDKPIFYIARDAERATGVEDLFSRYHIITLYASSFVNALKKKGVNIFVLEEECPSDLPKAETGGTYGLMRSGCVKKYIADKSGRDKAYVILLKTSELITEEAHKNQWALLAPGASVAKKYEDKISQFKALAGLVPFPPMEIVILEKLLVRKTPFVIQFNAGHSGAGTHVIQKINELQHWQEVFPKREVRLSPFLRGNTYTLNALIIKEGRVITGSISKQLTGIAEATNNPLATVGNDFGAVQKELTSEEAKKIADIARRAGLRMHQEGYVGFFGIDVILENISRTLYLIEINTHQPASISFEAKIHRSIGKLPLFEIFIRDMMVKESFVLLPAKLPPLIFPWPASQIIFRNKTDETVSAAGMHLPPSSKGLISARMKFIKPGEELYRIQYYEQ